VIDALVVGLGNPGKEYARTRHNVGSETVALLAERAGAKFKVGRDRALVSDVRIGGRRVILALPTTYMNDSGQAVGALMRRHKLDLKGARDDAVGGDDPVKGNPSQLIVVHDELDLPPGVVRVKVGGGLAGNNGLRSITQHLKTQDYVRVRIGIGKPPSKERGADHVLSRLPKAERELLDVSIVVAADAVEVLLAEGPDAAMRQFNSA
jgi:PTH1 family peptidyl-tRNA hydrolase